MRVEAENLYAKLDAGFVHWGAEEPSAPRIRRVAPAEAGAQMTFVLQSHVSWIPAFAGMTGKREETCLRFLACDIDAPQTASDEAPPQTSSATRPITSASSVAQRACPAAVPIWSWRISTVQ